MQRFAADDLGAPTSRVAVVPHPGSPDRLRLFRDGLTVAAASELRAWAVAAGIDVGERGDGAAWKEWEERATAKLFASRLDLSGPAPYIGLRALGAMERMEAFPPLSRTTLDLLVANAAQTRPLQNTELLYIGHATQAMLPLIPTLEAVGLARAHAVFGPFSGTGAVSGAIDLQLAASGGVVEWTSLAAGAPSWRQVALHNAAAVEAITQQARAAAWYRTFDRHRDYHLVIDKGGLIASHLNPELEGYIRDGTLRFVVHNRDDLKALGSLANEVWAVDLAGSRIKAVEAKLLGQQYALFGAREVRHYWGTRLPNIDVYVVGAGLLGGGTVDALLGMKLSPERITVVEQDAALRAEAEARDMRALSPEELVSRDDRSARALVYVATDGIGVDEANASAFGDEALILGITSGGKGVDMKGLRDRHPEAERVHTRFGGSSPGELFHARNDWQFELGEGERCSKVTVVADALPLNLLDESWPDRFAVTSSAVALATYTAAKLTGPRPPDEASSNSEPAVVGWPLDKDLEDQVLKEIERLGLEKPRPLDPSSLFRGDDDPVELRRDFELFAEPADVVGSFADRRLPQLRATSTEFGQVGRLGWDVVHRARPLARLPRRPDR
jgi:hypothetical protein